MNLRPNEIDLINTVKTLSRNVEDEKKLLTLQSLINTLVTTSTILISKDGLENAQLIAVNEIIRRIEEQSTNPENDLPINELVTPQRMEDYLFILLDDPNKKKYGLQISEALKTHSNKNLQGGKEEEKHQDPKMKQEDSDRNIYVEENPAHTKIYVENFKRIYEALRAGQNTPSLIKSNYLKNKEGISDEKFLKDLREYVKNNPNSRASEAFRLAKRHGPNSLDANETNYLLKQIHQYSVKKSWFAKTHGPFFDSQNQNIEEAKKSNDEHSEKKTSKKKTRSDKISSALLKKS